MKLKARFSLIAGGFVIFLILAPILVFYARGFKYDFATGQIVKTGTLVVRTEPKAKVFLNDDTTSADTPASIRFLLPQDYVVRVVKEGYHVWLKRLDVTEQFVTWASVNREKLFLLLEEPKLLNTTEHSAAVISSDATEITLASNGQEHLIRVDSGSRENLGATNSVTLPLPAQAKINWTQGAQIWQLLQTTQSWPISQAELEKIQHIYTNGKQTAVLLDGKLYSFDITTMGLIAEDVTGALLHGSDLWYTAGNKLFIYDFSLKTSQVMAEDLPVGSETQIIRAGNQLYLIIGGQLYQVKDTVERIYGPVTFARWNTDSGKVIYGNGNEAYLHDPISNRSELVLRSLTPISQVQLNWFTGFVFYLNEGKIKAAELDMRNGQNQFDILEFAENLNFLVAPEGDRLYLMGPTQIYEYRIR